MRRLAPPLLALVLGLVCALALLEVGVRLTGLWLRARQGEVGAGGPDGPSVVRVLCLGDSMTSGQYPRYLGKALARRVPGRRFKVIDQAPPRATARSIFRNLPPALARHRPDVVVVMAGLNPEGAPTPFAGLPAERTSVLRSVGLLRALWYRVFEDPITRTPPTAPPPAPDRARPRPGRRPLGARADNNDWTRRHQVLCGDRGEACDALVQELRAAVAQGNAGPDTYIRLSDILAGQSQAREALRLMEEARRLHPSVSRVHEQLGRAYRNLRMSGEAVRALQEAVRLDPGNGAAQFALGEWAMRRGDYRAAIERFAAAMAVGHSRGWTAYFLSLCYSELGEHQRAEATLRRALAMEPDTPILVVGLSWLLRDRGKHGEAERVLRRALQQNPEDDTLLGILAQVLADQGRAGEAAEVRALVHRQRTGYYHTSTRRYYRAILGLLRERGIRLVVVQYPMRSAAPLRRMLAPAGDTVFVENRDNFRDALSQSKVTDLFVDMYGGDFGHCTEQGNRLIAERIAEVMARELFGRDGLPAGEGTAAAPARE